MSTQAAGRARVRQESCTAKLAKFFPEASPVRIPVRLTRVAGDGKDCTESTVIEFGTAREVLFSSTLPLEFADRLQGAKFRWHTGCRSLRGGPAIYQWTHRSGCPLYPGSFQLDRETMTLKPKKKDLAAEWREARLLHPLYSALGREFVIELPPCPDLESGMDNPPQESVEQARQWFLEMDQKIQVHQLRQFLQTTSLTSEAGLQTLLEHHLSRTTRVDSDRDKIDFLLVQFFSHCAPSRLEDADVDLGYVAQTLEPVLGEIDLNQPSWLDPIEDFIQSANGCHSLNELLTSGILEKGRKLKISAGEDYFEPIAMVTFTRFSFLMRRVFFRLMHQDLNTILDGLRELEARGVETLDCRSAQFSADEPVARLRMICQSWKVMFHAEYSSGSPLRMLVDLRNVVDAALSRTTKKAVKLSRRNQRPVAPRQRSQRPSLLLPAQRLQSSM